MLKQRTSRLHQTDIDQYTAPHALYISLYMDMDM